MDTAGYLASLFIGISLGLIGGGGSILTVPVLVYLFGVDAVLATAYSLFVVGATSVAGAFSYFKKGLVNIRTALVFGLPSIFAVFVTRTFLVPAIPENILTIGNFVLTKGVLLMLLFAVLMLFSAYSMIMKCRGEDCLQDTTPNVHPVLVVVQGFMVGIVTGLVGAGGGFLIIPALVNLLKLDIKMAIGTSLFIIALNSLFGFAVSASPLIIDWSLIFKITALAILGVIMGGFISKRIDSAKLKPAFGWFVLTMGIYIILKETVFK